MPFSRRQFLHSLVTQGPLLALGSGFINVSVLAQPSSSAFDFSNIGPLQAPNKDGLCLPVGFTSRIVARSGELVADTNYAWHQSPDGGACFAAENGGWIYVSNAEEYFPNAGVSAIHFNKDGSIKNAYRILSESEGNCAGGATPWKTWLSCEEKDCGAVYETYPTGETDAVKQPALGYFKHEAVAVDTQRSQLYLTEDEKDGCLYRFTPKHAFPDLSQGKLEVAVVDVETIINSNASAAVSWVEVPEPNPVVTKKGESYMLRTRHQIPSAAKFKGGEGIWYQQGHILFSTKRDNKIWRLEINTQRLSVFYDAHKTAAPILTGVDNLTANQNGDLLVAEDGGDMQIVVLNKNGDAKPLLQVVHAHQKMKDSEITGPAFSPDGTRLYFSSQRGINNEKRLGITYEIRAL